MNSLHKKRQAFRQSIRSRSIQQLFARKRQELLHQLKQQSLTHQTGQHEEQKPHSHTKIGHLFDSNPQNTFATIKHFLSTCNQHIPPKDQQYLFAQITNNKYFMSSLQKIYLLSKLINRQQFALNHQIETNYGWKNIINEFLSVIVNDQQSIKRDIVMGEQQKLGTMQQNLYQSQIKKTSFLNMICFSLIKIWEIKPKYEYFLSLTKSYSMIYQKVSGSLSLTLIAELSYDRSLLPNYSFVAKLLEGNIKKDNELKFFRTLEILKNFITQFKVQNGHQIHPRQLIFQYFNWVKIQVNLILDEDTQTTYEKQKQEKNHMKFHAHEETSTQTRYFLIYLLFTILNKLSQVIQTQRQYLHNKQILLLNEQLLNFKENHTLLKFLIFEGKQSSDPHHKKNILRTLSFLISFLETVSIISEKKSQQNENQSTQKELQFGAQLQEIQKAFQGTDLEWFGSFN